MSRPEEAVRSACLELLTGPLGYPRDRISVECSLRRLPHLQRVGRLPSRRIDLLCWAGEGSALHPLLLVECKVGPLRLSGLRQAVHYNTFVGAPFVSLVSDQGVWLIEMGTTEPTDQLPSYEALLKKLSC
jgi:hypothetical protein